MESNFTIQVEVPGNFTWSEINSNLNITGVDIQMRPNVISHYAYLLRQASWQFGIDWKPVNGNVMLTVPNGLFSDKTTSDDGLYVDGLSGLLLKVLAEVDIATVKRHFITQ